MMRLVAALLGLALVVITSASILSTLVVPRGLSSRLSKSIGKAARTPFVLVADRCSSYLTKDRVLAPQGPVILIALLVSWLLLFLLAYAGLIYGVGAIGFGEALRQAGSAMFTLGFDTAREADVVALEFAAAATGPLVIALQIAYLPTIYSAYNRRETNVTLLQSRAGEPAWGPELLARHRLVDILDSLPEFYRDWERWAADVAESHTNYPVLAYFRSPKPLRSWVVALVAVLDSAALYLSTAPERAPSEARLCLRMGFLCLRDICDALNLPYDPDPRPDQPLHLSYEDFLSAVRRLEEADFPMERGPADAWPHFRGWRANYEQTGYALAARLEAVPALWSGPRRRSHAPMAPDRPPDRLPESPHVTHPPSYGKFKAH
jgi:hypothetical protein